MRYLLGPCPSHGHTYLQGTLGAGIPPEGIAAPNNLAFCHEDWGAEGWLLTRRL